MRNAKTYFEKSVVNNMTIDTKAFWGNVRENKVQIDYFWFGMNDDIGIANMLNKLFESVFVEETPGQLPIFDKR